MTTDGGKTWTKTLYIDNQHGVADLEIDPTNPNILYAGMWSFERKPWTHRSGSEKGGVYKSIDGGRTWSDVSSWYWGALARPDPAGWWSYVVVTRER